MVEWSEVCSRIPESFPKIKAYPWEKCTKLANRNGLQRQAMPMARKDRGQPKRLRKTGVFKGIVRWCRLQDSNLRPHHYE